MVWVGEKYWRFGINNLLLCLLFFQLVNVFMGIFCVQGGCGGCLWHWIYIILLCCSYYFIVLKIKIDPLMLDVL